VSSRNQGKKQAGRGGRRRGGGGSGTLDQLAGRALEAWGAMTGNRKTKTKGRAARLRGQGRTAKGRFKRRARG
jgi:uncharacterized protein YjbJ (UPF0337 family)